ncbi:hypothetical protein ONZ45_g10087 [Pleurotus djamor]|nr:hypothetical protein ONZ45_g10087 [Pleurotus djamor]
MTAKLPPELWALVIANHDAHDRRTLLPLQLVSKQLHSLVTPVIYTTISITFSGSKDFVEWAAARGGEQLRDVTTLSWEPQTSQTTFAHTAIPFHRLSNLQSTFASNPLLASYTTSLILKPFYEQVGSVDGWKEVLEIGWSEVRSIFPFFTSVRRVAVLSILIVPPEVLHNLPSPGHLTYLRILVTKNWTDVLPLFQLHPNLQLVGMPLLRGGPLPHSNELPDMCIDLPRLKILETGPNFWPFLSHCLSTSSFRSLRHFSILTIPTPMPPIPTLNHLLSLKIMSADTSLVRQLFQHLTLVEYISALTMSSEVNFLFNIPSAALKYIHLEYYLPDSDNDMPSPSELFDRFPKLAIVDMDNLGDDSDSCVSRFLRSQPSPVDTALGSLRPFQSWWESAQEELERLPRTSSMCTN